LEKQSKAKKKKNKIFFRFILYEYFILEKRITGQPRLNDINDMFLFNLNIVIS
jgi:hypothetical protein